MTLVFMNSTVEKFKTKNMNALTLSLILSNKLLKRWTLHLFTKKKNDYRIIGVKIIEKIRKTFTDVALKTS